MCTLLCAGVERLQGVEGGQEGLLGLGDVPQRRLHHVGTEPLDLVSVHVVALVGHLVVRGSADYLRVCLAQHNLNWGRVTMKFYPN